MQFSPIEGVRVIGVGHKARHGKDTIARALQVLYPMQVQRFAFADPLRMYCRLVHGMTKKNAPLLQRVGMEQREKDPLFWVKQTYWVIDELRPQVAVISDVRLKNEAQMVKDMGGVMINVTRYDSDGKMFLDPSRDPKHISETDMDDYPYDYYLRNDKGPGDLAIAASELYYQFD
jgi:hypothetical protein